MRAILSQTTMEDNIAKTSKQGKDSRFDSKIKISANKGQKEPYHFYWVASLQAGNTTTHKQFLGTLVITGGGEN